MLSPEQLPNDLVATIRFWQELIDGAVEQDEKAKTPGQMFNQARRWLCRNDLFYFLVVACGRKDMNHPWIHDRCREVQRAPNGFLDLWAREHYKSTIITFGLGLQDILASHGDEPEPRYEGREVTIGILSYNRPLAKSFLRQIKQEMESNQTLKDLFPDVLWQSPRDEAPKWSEDDGLIVRRKSNPKEATVEAYGLVDGQPVGKHYFIVNYDDVVTPASVSTPEMIQKTTVAWEMSDNVGTEGGWRRFIGTRYHLFDTYRTIMERGIPARIHPCTSDGSEDWSKSVLKSAEELARKRREQGPYTFGSQMLLNPTADTSQGFKEEWLKTWPARHHKGMNLILLVDPASSKKKTSDYTSMWVVGLGADQNYYIVDGIRDRLNLAERQRELFRLHRKYRPKITAYETYGVQADIEHMESKMDDENYRFVITRVGGKLAKDDRILRLLPDFEAGRIYLPEAGIVNVDYEGRAVDIVKTFREDEYLAFPVCAHDDQLDCLARLYDLVLTWPEATDIEEDDTPDWLKAELQQMAGGGNWMTT